MNPVWPHDINKWHFTKVYTYLQPSQVVWVVKNLPANAGDRRDSGSIPGSGRSPRGGHGNPLQYSWLENPTDRGAWRAMVHEVAQSQTWLKRLNTDARIKHVWAPRMFLLVCVCLVTQSCLTVCDPLSVACQTPLSLGFFRQAYWSALPFPNLCVRYHWIVAKYKACMSPLECVSSWSGLISVHNLWRSGFSGAFIDAHNWIKEWLSPLEVGMGMGIWEKSLNCR